MKNVIGLSIFLLLTTTTVVEAQDREIFGGNGVKGIWGNPNSNSGITSKSGAFGFLPGSGSTPAVESSGFQFPKLELPKLTLPKLEIPKLFNANANGASGLLSALPKFGLGQRNSNEPGFFQRMQERTRDLFGRTKSGIDNTSNHILGADKAARETWDSITQSLSGQGNGGSSTNNQPPAQPSSWRSAEVTDGSTTRF